MLVQIHCSLRQVKDQRRLCRPFTSAGLAQTLKRTRAGIEQLGFGTYHQKDWLVDQDWRLALQCFPIIRILADMSIEVYPIVKAI